MAAAAAARSDVALIIELRRMSSLVRFVCIILCRTLIRLLLAEAGDERAGVRAFGRRGP